ncbi:MAG TPA: response regulator [Ktedonobacterales bacterium]|nr:response regulator [Ktedonobacterales bacterium]
MVFKEAQSQSPATSGLAGHADSQTATTSHGGQPVLIVEDDSAIRESLAQMLREEGYAVTMARDGIEALRLLAEARERYVIFLDVLMPRMDGVEFCERLLADPALRHDHAIILMSAWFHHSAAIPAVAAAHLYKPFDIETVLELAQRFSVSTPSH